jgi:hypothetical protein
VEAASRKEIESWRLSFRQCAAEDLILAPGEPRYDLAVAVRVGALDGRHADAGVIARQRIKAALKPSGKLFIDGGNPLLEVPLRD